MSGTDVPRWTSIPDFPPEGERVLWTGAPDPRGLARHAFHVRKVAVYFCLLLAWRAWAVRGHADPLAGWLEGAVPLAALGAVAIGTLWLVARLTARATTYAVTDRRVVLRIGVALPKVVNLPLEELTGAADRRYRDGTGDVAFLPAEGAAGVPFMILWPHARAWRFSPAQPAMRALPDADAAVTVLREALGRTVHAGSRDAAAAPPDRIAVSTTVRDGRMAAGA